MYVYDDQNDATGRTHIEKNEMINKEGRKSRAKRKEENTILMIPIHKLKNICSYSYSTLPGKMISISVATDNRKKILNKNDVQALHIPHGISYEQLFFLLIF